MTAVAEPDRAETGHADPSGDTAVRFSDTAVTEPAPDEELVPRAPAVYSTVVTKRGAAAGTVARWRYIADHLLALKPGDVLSYEDMALVTGMDFNDEPQLKKIKMAARTASQHLLHEHGRVFEPVRGFGFEECVARQVVKISQTHQGRAVDEIERAAAKLNTVNPEELDYQERTTLEASKLLLGHQVQVMHLADIRSKRHSEAFARLRAVSAPPPPPGVAPVRVEGVPRVVTGPVSIAGSAAALQAQGAHPEG